MAHFAELDESNIVLRVIVVNNEVITNENGIEDESIGIAFCQELFGANTRWAQTSYNNSMRYRYCAPGYTFDEKNQAFIAPQPYASWKLDDKFNWIAPVPYPEDGNLHGWNEEKLAWEKIEFPKAS